MHISICRIDGVSEQDVERALECLSLAGLNANECAHLRGIRHLRARAASVGARLALLWALVDGGERLSVHDLCDLPFMGDKPLASLVRTESGAPRLTDDDRFVSFAHSDRLAICALSHQGRIGVDVEPLDRRITRAEDIANRYFSTGEQALLAASADRCADFLRIWTRKEALGKALGTGLNNRADALDTTKYDSSFFETETETVVEESLVSVCVLREPQEVSV